MVTAMLGPRDSSPIDRLPPMQTVLVHTGQHYDKNLSDVFFDDLGMRRPDLSLEVGSGSHAEQTARILQRTEQLLLGDAAVKLKIPVAHVEAVLRSFDRSMPEEINRLVTDSTADMLFVSEPAGQENRKREGHRDEDIHLVCNVMIDTLFRLLPRTRELETIARLGLEGGRYGVLTLHRPSNVDDSTILANLLEALADVSSEIPLVFPIHPRTKKRIEDFGLTARLNAGGLLVLPPLGYLEFMSLTCQARVIATDSGGLQEESTALGIPCLTMRENAERPITVEQGTSTLVGNDVDKLKTRFRQVVEGTYKQGSCPSLWDGHAAERIARVLGTPVHGPLAANAVG